MFSHFTLACIITDKKLVTNINCITQTWIGSGLLVLKKFLPNKGEKFQMVHFQIGKS